MRPTRSTHENPPALPVLEERVGVLDARDAVRDGRHVDDARLAGDELGLEHAGQGVGAQVVDLGGKE
jgi:hypothetical protein